MSKLDDVLNDYDEALEEGEKRTVSAQSVDQIAEEKFLVLVEKKIIPAMESSKEELEARGHQVKIETFGELTFEFRPKGKKYSGTSRCDIPHFSFRRNGDMVNRHMCRMSVRGGGQSGAAGQFSFEEFNEELIEDSVFRLVEYALTGRNSKDGA